MKHHCNQCICFAEDSLARDKSPSTLEINITVPQGLPGVTELFPWSVNQTLLLCRPEEQAVWAALCY